MQLGLNKHYYNHMKSNHTSIKAKTKLVKTESIVPYTKCTYICTYSQSIIQSLTNNHQTFKTCSRIHLKLLGSEFHILIPLYLRQR